MVNSQFLDNLATGILYILVENKRIPLFGRFMRIGTRGSALARVQAHLVAQQLGERLGIPLEILVIQTQGDKVTDRPLRELEGRGYFTKEIEEALLNKTIDIAVHSFKDMPSQTPEGLAVAAVSPREDPADLLIVRPDAYTPSEREIPVRQGATVGTSAVRRETQLLALRQDVVNKDLRGNVPTRIAKLAGGQYDAIFLASAGVRRLNLDLTGFNVVRLDPTRFVPSPGQGALAIQMREDDAQIEQVRGALHDEATGTATAIERSVQHRFGGGCGLPLGAYALRNDSEWHLYGFWGGDRSHPVWAEVHAGRPEEMADQLYSALERSSHHDATCTDHAGCDQSEGVGSSTSGLRL
jgi:hydroxymethylbilane synthase